MTIFYKHLFAVISKIEEIIIRDLVIIIILNHMESSLGIYSSTAPQNIGKALYSGKARRLEADIAVTIYETCLMEVSSKGAKYYIILDYDLKFASQMSPPSIMFEKG
jgi:hypothetical protein